MTKNVTKCALFAVTLFPALGFAQGGSYIVKGKLSQLRSPSKVHLAYAIDKDY